MERWTVQQYKEYLESQQSTGKYNNIRERFDGYYFDSQQEKKRYCELKLLKRAGEIKDFKVHPEYRLSYGSKSIIYEGDFEVEYPDGRKEVEDVKGVETAVFRIKKKMFIEQYPNLKLVIIKSDGWRDNNGLNGRRKKVKKDRG